MASVNFKEGKHKGATETKAQFRHSYTDERLIHDHANKQIDKTLTEENVSLKGYNYSDVCDAYDARIEEIEKTNTNKRKDRITCNCLNIPVPKGMTDRKMILAWFARVADILKDQYGEENFIDIMIHFDEVHEYLDPRTGEWTESRVHGHAYETPEHEGSLNGKWFSSRANMNKLNNAIHAMTKREFGMEFMDGSKRKSKSTVEDLKQASLVAERDKLREDIEGLRNRRDTILAQNSDLQAQNNVLQDTSNTLTKDIDTKKIKNKYLQNTNDSLQAQQEALQGQIERFKDVLDKYPDKLQKSLERLDSVSEEYKNYNADDRMIEFMKTRKRKNGKTLYEDYTEEQEKERAEIQAKEQQAREQADKMRRQQQAINSAFGNILDSRNNDSDDFGFKF